MLRALWRWLTRPRDAVADGLLATFLARRDLEQSVNDALARALAPEKEHPSANVTLVDKAFLLVCRFL